MTRLIKCLVASRRDGPLYQGEFTLLYIERIGWAGDGELVWRDVGV